MLTPDTPRRRLRGTAAATLAALMLVPASTTMAMDTAAAEAEPGGGEALAATASADELRTLVDDLSLANDELTADNSTLKAELDVLVAERDRLRASLTRFDDLYDPLEADRQLVLELRKGLPETRPEAEAQLVRIRSLALSSDPARLGQLVDRIDDTAPAYLDWRFSDDGTVGDFNTYIESGANAFDSSMEEFRSAVLMSVANRLDGLLTILDRVR